MRKILTYIVIVLLVMSCQRDEIIEPINGYNEIPESLIIEDVVGVRLESSIVTDEVRMNVKLPYSGQYRIKIRHGLDAKLLSQEKINANEGDNLLKVYVNTLNKSGYILDLTDIDHKLLSRISFEVK